MKEKEKKNPYASLSVLNVKAPNENKTVIKSAKKISSTDLRAKAGK